MVALDSSLGEPATYGHADGRTMYGSLVGRHEFTNASGRLPYWNSQQQSRVFIGSEATRRAVVVASSANLTGGSDGMTGAAQMVPAGYGAGEWSFRLMLLATIQGSFHVGMPSWLTQVKQGAHWSPLTLDGVATRRIGHSATLSSWAVSGRRKDGETADTIYATRVVGTWASWSLFLAAVYADWATPGHLHYWETIGSV